MESVLVGPRHSTGLISSGRNIFLDEGKNEGVCEGGKRVPITKSDFRVFVACMMVEPSLLSEGCGTTCKRSWSRFNMEDLIPQMK